MRPSSLLPIALLLTACVEPREPVELLDHGTWTVSDRDPWPAHAPEPIDCSALAWSYETVGGSPSLEVRTGSCNYLVVEQETVADALAGDVIQVRLWHYDLISFEAATAHAALRIGDVDVFDVEIPLPASEVVDAEMVVQEVTLSEDLPTGTPAVFHLHNHGENTWNLVEISANPPE